MDINGLDNGVYWPTKVDNKVPEGSNQELNQEDFFELLTQQLAYQDPSKPVENADMIAQMSSFQTSEGISKLSNQFETLNSVMNSSAALQASTLVGRSALVPLEHGYNDGAGFDGVAITGSGASNIKVTVESSAGEAIKTLELGEGSGNVNFSWDGTNNEGNPVPEGKYKIKVNAMQGGDQIALPTATYGHVSSVSLAGGSKGVIVNLNGLGGMSMNDVLEVGEG
jgi:flagellar basal-body rod modification protein FlgD